MQYTEAVARRIQEALQAKGAPKACPMCGTDKWTMPQGFVYLTIQKELPMVMLGGNGLPCVALVCNNCGNTHFFNILQLGLHDLLTP